MMFSGCSFIIMQSMKRGLFRFSVNGLRSVQPLGEEDQKENLRKDIMNALAEKNVTKSDS